MKSLYFLKNSSIISTVQKFRLLDYKILLHVTVLDMMLKGLRSIYFQ